MSLLYCYGVIGKEERFTITSFEDKQVYTIAFKDIYAVVSDVNEDKFSQQALDKNVKDMSWLTINAPVHEEVVEKIMKKCTVIPMKFCTIFKDKESLLSMMEEKYGDLKYNLDNLDGKVEMGVKVYVEFEKIRGDIIKTMPEAQKLEEEASHKQPGAAYMLRQKLDLLVKDRLQTHLDGDSTAIFDQLRKNCVDAKQNPVLPKKTTGKDMLLNIVFLIVDVYAFKKIFTEVEKKYQKYEFKLSGPFPAYNFVK